ncbi:oxidoreductase [Sinorhizobium terangae]|uniref:SDR family NAD(P)-dependent oxidoreductase n=1 Tax=Sinorhizobium terangae TaxID=110322 RepID=A0A6N7LCJ6_SINTE|nr:oxidoreductase [Sinorhizobium terangae]MBB4188313.1 short-subunit dehydrogenase [Sinorhizobium terangae]MQX15336.1 SDR family NAD(P)-dependent oxidoreductase [Sinorhizobium terangae]WFU46681.1 oxidoreductase [Sinorhizobium terangae]
MAQTWFITGCSTGFGRALAQHVIALGHNVVVTARDAAQVADLTAIAPDRTLALALDVTKADDIAAATRAAEERFGHIDILVNNAGVGYFGAFEESDMDAVRAMFEVNVWGLANMTRAVLPGMRRRRSGTIVNISSVGGLRSVPSLSFYAASKFAVEALSEGLSKETEPLGIKVLIVEPGPFRTDWAGRSAGEATVSINDYEDTAGAVWRRIRGYSGKQPGDPDRAARAIVMAVNAAEPPLRLLLGREALAGARAKLDALRKDFDAWAEVTEGADFPAAESN